MGRKKRRKKMENNLQTSEKKEAAFKLVIDEVVYQKIMYFVNRSNVEVSGFGALEYDENTQTFRAVDAYCLDEGSSTETEVSPEMFNKAAYLMRDYSHGAKWHWHSHHNMDAFLSGTDMSLIRGLGYNGWILASVFNKKANVRTAYCSLTTVMGAPHEVFIDNIPTTVDKHIDQELVNRWEQEYQTAVKIGEKRRPAAQMYLGNYNHSMDRSYERNYDNVYRGGYQYESSRFKSFGYGSDDWDHEGWRQDKQTNRLFYNPMKDKFLKSDQQRWEECLSLKPDEFNELMKDKEFRDFVVKQTEASKTANLPMGELP